jgi:hypothetical protein
MRQQTFIGAGAAAVLAVSALAGGAFAHAEDAAPSPASDDTVVLPTGDRVTMLPNGVTAIDPAEGREDVAFLTPKAPGVEDVIVIPTDMAEAVADGEEDPRRYNITRLLAEGRHDAAAVKASELDRREYEGLLPASANTEDREVSTARDFTLTILDRSGDAPDGANVVWADAAGEGFGYIDIGADGTGTVALEPGEYHLAIDAWGDPEGSERGEMIAGFASVTVGEEPTALVVDAAEAAPVGVEVERPDAEALASFYSANARGERDLFLSVGGHFSPAHDGFLLPRPDAPKLDFDFIYQPVLAGTGAEGPYVYHLAFAERDSLPEDAVFEVRDEDLAELEVEYQSLGVDLPGRICDYGDVPDGQIGAGLCIEIDTPVPSTRTMFYTPGPEIEWGFSLAAGETDDEGYLAEGFVAADTEVLAPGEAARRVVHGPLGAGRAELSRWSGEDSESCVHHLDPGAGSGGEFLFTVGNVGSVVLSGDGEEIGRVDDLDFYMEGAEFPLPEGDSGRYTLTAETTETPANVLFGTEASLEWSFDSEPLTGEEYTVVALPVVAFGAKGVEGGYADRDEPLEVTLELVSSSGPDTDAVEMGFEVSYDDGATWTEVALDRDGDTATAVLEHPEGAEFASVRMSALDDAGTEVGHTTIRSFGLR